MGDYAVKITDATVRFNLAMQKQMSMREYFVTLFHKELFFQEFYALKNINLEIKQGEGWGFVGKNGSGKSTLLKLITGIIKPYRGSVEVDGNIAPLLELGAGFDNELTGRENIIMNGLILGMTKKNILARFDEIVAFSEIEEFLDVPLKNYSSGMRSRLGFSIATSAKPDILIADEVLSTGDKDFQAKCEKRIQSLLQEGTTLLFVSHSDAMVQRLCQKAMWIDGGCCKCMGDVKDVLQAYSDNAKK